MEDTKKPDAPDQGADKQEATQGAAAETQHAAMQAEEEQRAKLDAALASLPGDQTDVEYVVRSLNSWFGRAFTADDEATVREKMKDIKPAQDVATQTMGTQAASDPQAEAAAVDPAAIPTPPDHFDASVVSRIQHMFARTKAAVEGKLETLVRDELLSIPTLHLPEIALQYRDSLVTHLGALIAANAKEQA